MSFAVAATSVKVVGGTAYVTIDDAGACRFSVLKDGCVESVALLRGSPCALVWGSREGLLVSCGETLYLVSGNEAKPVLRARSGNWFWHACEGDGRFFVQEYGEPPTGIYVTEDLETFARVATNLDVDPSSKHFHFVAFDGARGLLVATLGDGNLVRRRSRGTTAARGGRFTGALGSSFPCWSRGTGGSSASTAGSRGAAWGSTGPTRANGISPS